MHLAKRGWLRNLGSFAGIAVVTVCFTGTASAGEWRLEDSVTASATVVDDSEGSSGTVLQLSPSLNLTGKGGRSKANAHYRLTLSEGTGDTNPRPIAHSLLAAGEVEAIEDFFFLGGEATARLSSGDGTTTSNVDSINFDRRGGQQSYSLRVKPIFKHHLNRYADFVSNNSVDYVVSDSGNSDSDSTSSRLHLGVQSGRYFGPLSWRSDVSQRSTHYDDRDDSTTTASAGVGYRVNPRLNLNSTIGWEDNDVETSRSDTNGITWSVGAAWNPTSRTSLSANYGSRYFGHTYSGQISHVSRRTRTGITVSRDISNRRSFELVDSFFFLADENGNIIVDPDTGDPVIVNIPDLRDINEDFISTRVSGIVTVTGRRTNVSVTGYLSKREYEVSQANEDTYGMTAHVSRRLGGDYSASVSGGYTHSVNDNDAKSDSFDVRFSLSKRLSPRTSASLSVSHQEDDFSDSGTETENRIGLSLTTSFL